MTKQFDILELLTRRPLSWSALSSFEWDKQQWYDRYVLNIKDPPSNAMLFGKKFGEAAERGEPMAPVTILSKMEYEFRCMFGNIPLLGFADTFDHVTMHRLGEYKTAGTAWTQDKVNKHGQLTMYAMMNLVCNQVLPEECDIFLESVTTVQNGDFTVSLKEPTELLHFDTKRTIDDVVAFGARINRTVKEMETYARERQGCA